MTNESLQQQLTDKFGDQLTNWQQPYGMLTFTAPKELNLKVLQFLYDEAGFKFLTDLQAVHYPDKKGEEFAVVYHVHNMVENVRVRFKIFTSINDLDVYSATALFAGANWMERETYDFYGINFVGHPNLIRVLNVDEMDYFPMRKEYPLEDQTRIDKDDEMFGRGGLSGFGTEKIAPSHTIAEDEKPESDREKEI